MLGSRSDGPDRLGTDSNLGRRFSIGRLRVKGRAGGGGTRRETNSRGGASPEKSKSGLPGVESSGIWAVRGLRDTRSPPGAFAGLGEVRGGACCDGGGFPWRRSPERGVWWFWGSGSSAKGPESLHKALANRCRVRAGHPHGGDMACVAAECRRTSCQWLGWPTG